MKQKYRHSSNYFFILDLTPGCNGLGKDKYKTWWETFKCWYLGCIMFDSRCWVLRHLPAQWLMPKLRSQIIHGPCSFFLNLRLKRPPWGTPHTFLAPLAPLAPTLGPPVSSSLPESRLMKPEASLCGGGAGTLRSATSTSPSAAAAFFFTLGFFGAGRGTLIVR